MTKVSVITVVYNNKNKIERTIQNVLSQTYRNIEYIVIDGASIDGTADIVKRYDSKIKWLSEPDKGIYDAMMKGVLMATGEWILFRNCGDYFFQPSSIEDIFNNYNDCGEDFLIADSRLFTDWGYLDCKPPILSCSYFDAMPVLHPSTFIRRSTQLKYAFHLEYKNSADYCFFVEALIAGATYRYFSQLIALVETGKGVTSDYYDRTLSENIDFLKKLGAEQKRINGLKRDLWIHKFMKFVPFAQQISKIKMIKAGWKKCDMSLLV